MINNKIVFSQKIVFSLNLYTAQSSNVNVATVMYCVGSAELIIINFIYYDFFSSKLSSSHTVCNFYCKNIVVHQDILSIILHG